MENKDFNTLSTIDYKRLQLILKNNGILQNKLKLLLNCSQSSVSQKLNGQLPLSNDELKLIENTYGIQIPYLSELEARNLLKEPDETYSSKNNDLFSKKSCGIRLRQQIEAYMIENKIDTRKEACEKLRLKYTHTTNVINGAKAVSIEILRQIHLNGSFNLHYTLFNEDSMFIPKMGYSNRINFLESKVAELEKDKKNLQVLIDLLQNTEQSKAIA